MKLRQCLDVIHTDIISVWNIRDQHKVRPVYYATLVIAEILLQYLASAEFKSTMSKLVEDLVPPQRTSVCV
jgi:hypothetical protein